MLQTRTILAIDDDPEILEAVEAFLNAREYNVVTAQRWTEAIALLTDASPDAVLLDLHMPTVQGEALLEFIRENHAELPVVIISAGATPAEMARLGELGANGFIRKPFDTEDLIVILEQVLLDLETESRAEPPTSPAEPPLALDNALDTDEEEEALDDQEEEEEDDDEDETEAALSTLANRSQLPSNISPGSGVQNMTRMQPQPKQEVRRRRKKKRTGVRKITRLRKIRNLALIVLFFVAMSYGIYHFRQSFDTNFVGGISFGTQKTE